MVISFFISIFLGIILADFISGFVHWVQDRYAKPSWPIVGPAVADAIEHHSKPFKMLSASFIKRNGTTMILVALIGLIIKAFDGLNVLTVTALIVGSLANEIHATNHRRDFSAWWIDAFRTLGLVQTPAQHAKHHRHEFTETVRSPENKRGYRRPPPDRAYCVITNWLNPALDHLDIWTGLEVILIVFGIWPNEKNA